MFYKEMITQLVHEVLYGCLPIRKPNDKLIGYSSGLHLYFNILFSVVRR